MNEREAFEAWAQEPPREMSIARYKADSRAWPDQYVQYEVQCSWQAWQARAALADAERARVAKRCAEIAGETVCDTHLPTGIRIYGTKAKAAILAEFPEAK